MSAEPESLPLSALQHLLYCPRQCALIHLEQAWEENRFTAEGRTMHTRAHEAPSESRPGVRVARGLHVRSARLGVYGVCDVVEFHADGTVLPIEYKRGKPKSHRADEAQVCAQALCLEGMLGFPGGAIPRACLFYGKRRRRREVELDDDLRDLTRSLADRLHELIDSRRTPPAEYSAAKCNACSLLEVCRPKALQARRSASAWFARRLQSQISNPESELQPK